MGLFAGGVMLDNRTRYSRAVTGATLRAVDPVTGEALPTFSAEFPDNPKTVTTNGNGAYEDFIVPDYDAIRLEASGVSQSMVSQEVLAGKARSLAQPVATSADLPAVERDGSLRITEDDLHLWVWEDSGPGWTDLGSLRGEPGPGGATDAAVAALVKDPTSTRTAVELVADAAVAPIAPDNGERAVGQDELVLDAATRGLPTDGTTDASPAIRQTIADARALARVSGTWARGAPVIRLPKGSYRVSTTVLLNMIRGVTIQGDGQDTTVLYVDSGIDLLRIHRAGSVHLRDLTLACSTTDTGVGNEPWNHGLVENACGIHITERNDDAVTGISNTNITFERVGFIGFHRAVLATGNQMGDNVTFMQCAWKDNFYDIELQNGQTVNWRVIGGEVQAFVAASEATYNNRLSLWSTASKPVTAPGSTTTSRDGAVIRALAGGDMKWMGTSFIVNKTRLLLAELPADGTATDTYGTPDNQLPFVFDTCSAEVRGDKDGGDTFGYDRKSLLRYEMPHPTVSASAHHSTVVAFLDNRCTVTPSQWTALHVKNRVSVVWERCRLIGSGRNSAEVVSCLTQNTTHLEIGRFWGEGSTFLNRRRVGRTGTGAAWASPSRGMEHDITQERSLASTAIQTNPALGYDRALTSGRPRQRMVVAVHEIDGTIPHGNPRRVILPPQTVLLRVSVVALSAPGTPATLEFRRSTGTVISSLTVSNAAGTESVASAGRKLDDCRAPVHDVNVEVTDGVLAVVQVGTVNPGVLGHALIEYA